MVHGATLDDDVARQRVLLEVISLRQTLHLLLALLFAGVAVSKLDVELGRSSECELRTQHRGRRQQLRRSPRD
jgi:hypothetical protein